MPMTMPWPMNLLETTVWTKRAKKREDEDLREGDEVELLEVLEELVVVVAGDGLHEDAAEHGDGEQDEFDDDEGGELGEPVGGFAHGQRVVNAVEVGVALAPDELGGVERGDDDRGTGSRCLRRPAA